MSATEGDDGLVESDNERFDMRQLDQDRTLMAMHKLEASLGNPAPGRQGPWRNEVRSALAVLSDATAQEAENSVAPDSLLSDIARTQPRLRNRVRALRLHYRQLQESIASLQRELAEDDVPVDFADIRQRLAWALTGLRHQRARESDLIYEAYYDAFQTDLPNDVEDDLRNGEGR
jgi:ATP phosphoribosyltransferase regulatory subunit HisZ